MARTGDEMDAHPFNVVVRIVQAVDFQIAAIARTAVDMSDGECASDVLQDLRVDLLHLAAQCFIRLRRLFGFDPGAQDLFYYLIHG